MDLPRGEDRWLTVVSPEGPDDIELLLEPKADPAAKTFRDDIAATAMAVDDIHREYERLSDLGVEFTMPPTAMVPVTQAVLDDTCGNLIQVHQA